MKFEFAMLLSDWLIWALFLVSIMAVIYMRRHRHLREPWKQVFRNRLGVSALVVLLVFCCIGMLDSIHLRIGGSSRGSIARVEAVLDLLLSPIGSQDEKTYSAPFATHLYGKERGVYPHLKYAGKNITTSADKKVDIANRVLWGAGEALLSFVIVTSLLILYLSKKHNSAWYAYGSFVLKGKVGIAWREILLTVFVIWLIILVCWNLAAGYHLFGTDKIGRDVFYEVVRSIRTGLLIGTLTTLFMLPFALILGMLAGFYRGWVDDIIQYLYTTLSSIPGVLLISAAILVMQVYISRHPSLFPSLMQRADARLLALCLILGITSWAGLCRLLRGETLKLREMEFIQASRALGVRRFVILLRHIMPNVMHIFLITVVLDFSGLVLAEAVLSYVDVGFDPTTSSWGNIINSSRLELAREPVVWWPLLGALIFMFVLVLAANIFSDAVRDALDPRLRQTSE